VVSLLKKTCMALLDHDLFLIYMQPRSRYILFYILLTTRCINPPISELKIRVVRGHLLASSCKRIFLACAWALAQYDMSSL
jgi:hypothetical protein